MNNRLLIIVCITMVIQSFNLPKKYMGIYNYLDFPISFSFLLGVPTETNYPILMMWCLVFAAISFYFSGFFSELIGNYGQYMLVRNASKFKLLIGTYFSISKKLFMIVFFQGAIWYMTVNFLGYVQPNHYDIPMILLSICIYYLALLTIIMLQMILELYVSPEISLLIINLYVLISLLINNLLQDYENIRVISYFFIPIYANVIQTSLVTSGNLVINYYIAVPLLIIMLLLIIFVSNYSLKRKDFY